MSSLSFSAGRVSSQSQTSSLLNYIRQTQQELDRAQTELATGKKVDRPSDGAASVSAILKLRESILEREQADLSLQSSLATLNTADQALDDARANVLEARDTALSQIGVTSDASTRDTMALIVENQLNAMVDIANRQYSGLSLFGGNNGAESGGLVFESFLGGVRYLGGDENLQADVGTLETREFTGNGVEAFGAVSSRIHSDLDLTPAATAAVRLDDLQGATLQGITRGEVAVVVNGTTVVADLSNADTLDDVVEQVNAAIDTVAVGAGTLSIGGNGFVLSAAGGNSLSITDDLNGATAASLGINASVTGGSVAGNDLNVRITESTPISALGPAIDWASGLLIQQGETSAVADFSTATTVQDVLNAVSSLNLGVRFEINDDATGLSLVTEVSGVDFSVGENGGTTASDLGLRTMDLDTPLAHYRDGLGVEIAEGEDDMRVVLHDGRRFDINLDGAETIGDVITAMETAATAAGVAVGADFTVGLATTGNGLVVQDGTAGGTGFQIQMLNTSHAAEHLGLNQQAAAGSTIDSGDGTVVRVDSLFTHLADIASALRANDDTGMTIAGEKLEEDLDALSQTRARIGIRTQRIEDDMLRSQDLGLTEQTLLSNLQDADLTEVITRFQLLQQQLQATLQVGSQRLSVSLLDFLG